MLARVRESAEAQLRMYREESEQIFSSSLTALKAQIDTDTKKIEELTNRNVRMVGEIGELMATVRKMEGQVGIIMALGKMKTLSLLLTFCEENPLIFITRDQ